MPMLRQLLVTFIILLTCSLANATECADREFHSGQVDLKLCQNYASYLETRSLLYKARTRALADHIRSQHKNPALHGKLFEIEIYDRALTFAQLSLTRSGDTCRIRISGYPSLKSLLVLVDYFARPNWQPFEKSNEEIVGKDEIVKEFLVFAPLYKSIAQPAIVAYRKPLFTLGNLHLDYVGDSLRYYLGKWPLSVQPTSSLPVKINDRILLFQSDRIFVLQGSTIILRQDVIEPILGEYDLHTTSNEVMICDGGKDNWVFIYDYKRNAFKISARRK